LFKRLHVTLTDVLPTIAVVAFVRERLPCFRIYYYDVEIRRDLLSSRLLSTDVHIKVHGV